MKAIETSIVHSERKVTAVILIPMCVAVSLFHNAGCGFHRNISYISIYEPSNYSLLVISGNPLKSFLSREITRLNHLVRKKRKRQSGKKSFIKTKHKKRTGSLQKNYILPEKISPVLQIMNIQLHFFLNQTEILLYSQSADMV